MQVVEAAVVQNRKTQAESPAMLGQTSPRDKRQWHRAAIPPGLLRSGGGLHTLGGRKRIYAIGGEGGISVFEQSGPNHYKESARITTVGGARTGFFSPDLDRLFLAVRRQGAQTAAIRVFVPVQ